MYWLNNVLGTLIFIVGFAALVAPWMVGTAIDSVPGKVAGFMISAIVLWGCVFGLVSADIGNLKSTQETTAFKVNKSESVTRGKSDSKYLVYTDKGVFENTDEWYFGKFNSSDLYNDLEAGKSYSCTTVGWRVEFWSSYRNLINCKATS